MADTKVMWLYSGHFQLHRMILGYWSWIRNCHIHLAMTNHGDCHFKFFQITVEM